MLTILLTSIVLTAAPGEPTEIIGTAATPDGGRDEITVEQPQNAPNPFGYIAPSPNSQFRCGKFRSLCHTSCYSKYFGTKLGYG